MKRDELEKMNLDALRALARERDIEGANDLTRTQLIERLAAGRAGEGARALVERARGAVAHAVERMEAEAQKLAGQMKKMRGQDPESSRRREPGPKAEGSGTRRERYPTRPGFDVPSSTVHPHAEELETLSMARLYQQEGQTARALEIFEKLAALTPDDESLRRTVEQLRQVTRAASPPAAPGPAASSPPAPSEPLSMLDLEELPETYGVDECEVLYKDPFTVFAYWEVTEAGLGAARAQLGPSGASARLVLRLFTTGVEGGEREIRDLDLTWNHGRRYLPAPRPGAQLRVAVGLLSQEGYFAPVAHSSHLRIPPAEPGPLGEPVEWMEVVPGQSRGRVREPIVIVRSGAGHAERGLGEAGWPAASPRGATSRGGESWGPGSGSGAGAK